MGHVHYTHYYRMFIVLTDKMSLISNLEIDIIYTIQKRDTALAHGDVTARLPRPTVVICFRRDAGRHADEWR
jgi:hypothetical protein